MHETHLQTLDLNKFRYSLLKRICFVCFFVVYFIWCNEKCVCLILFYCSETTNDQRWWWWLRWWWMMMIFYGMCVCKFYVCCVVCNAHEIGDSGDAQRSRMNERNITETEKRIKKCAYIWRNETNLNKVE